MRDLRMKLKGDIVVVSGMFTLPEGVGGTYHMVEIPVEEYRRFAKEQLGMQEAKT